MRRLPFLLTMYFKAYKSESDGGRYRWIGVYTNSFEDLDYPSDTITSEAHKDAVRKMQTGEYEMPPLFLLHNEHWKIGDTDMVAIDEVADGIVFVIATGLVDEDKEFVVGPLSSAKSTMSQGVRFFDYSLHISRKGQRRDVHEYRTYEISVLPEGIANPANPLTYFSMEVNSEMSIDKTVRGALANLLGADAVEKLEASNAVIAGEAAEAGTKFKDLKSLVDDITGTNVEAEALAEEPVAEAETEVEAEVEDAPITEEPVAEEPAEELVELSLDSDAIASAINAHIDMRIGQLALGLKAIADQQEELQRQLDSANARLEATEKDLGGVKNYVAQPLASTQVWEEALLKMAGESINKEEAQPPVEKPTGRKSLLDSIMFGESENA